MSEEASFATPENSSRGQNIDLSSEAELQQWASKLDASTQQIRDAVAEVGPRAADVEEHLKGSRATTNAEKVRAAGRA